MVGVGHLGEVAGIVVLAVVVHVVNHEAAP
jgi:hypothetical protein